MSAVLAKCSDYGIGFLALHGHEAFPSSSDIPAGQVTAKLAHRHWLVYVVEGVQPELCTIRLEVEIDVVVVGA